MKAGRMGAACQMKGVLLSWQGGGAMNEVLCSKAKHPLLQGPPLSAMQPFFVGLCTTTCVLHAYCRPQ